MTRKTNSVPGIRDVAKMAGVSVATASRVIAKADYPVAAATRVRVIEAAGALGFVRNAMARGLSRSRSESVGVIVPALHAYYAAMIEGIDEAATRQGLTILLGLSRGDEAKREQLVTEFLERRVDGLLICAGADDHLPGRTPTEMPIPTVLIGQQANPGFPIVVTDNVAAGYEVAEHLWSLGHRAFAYLAPDKGWHDFRDRQAGVSVFLKQADEAYKLDVLDGIYSEADAFSRMGEALKDGLAATAVIASTDRHALGAMAALTDAGRRVPDAVAVVGFDNYLSSQYLRPALTSMHMPAGEMGRLGLETLVAAIGGHQVPMRSELRATLVARGSSVPSP
ncbi:LacI family DNA-binding transcriptional regulator [Rhizobium rhizogenes]|uniref:LacI family DNA-binding transcriptional regulator n=1 Tax=Rhizobium rhizogenes TaxID=359 RepID=UPI0009B84D43|nr:LacI family DNA-binding transcriptional regulator [Rhizobium rhizogenes]